MYLCPTCPEMTGKTQCFVFFQQTLLFKCFSTFIHSTFKPDDEMLNETRQLKRLKYINGQLFGLTIFLYHDKKYYDLKQQKNT